MEMKEVKSSQIHSIGHDAEKNVLAVRFKVAGEPGPTYHYDGVDAAKHGALVGAESIGKHFHANIRNAHKGVKQP